MRSAWPMALIVATFAPFSLSAISVRRFWPSGFSSALSNSNSTSEERLICSMTGGGGATTSGAGAAGATATGGTGASARRTASHGAAAFSGVQSVVLQHCPYGEVQDRKSVVQGKSV